MSSGDQVKLKPPHTSKLLHSYQPYLSVMFSGNVSHYDFIMGLDDSFIEIKRTALKGIHSTAKLIIQNMV